MFFASKTSYKNKMEPFSVGYYIEINLISIWILGYLYYLNRKQFGTKTTEDAIFNGLLFCTVPYCISDIFAWYFNGKPGESVKAVLYASNIIYIAFPIIISVLWADIVLSRFEYLRIKRDHIGHICLIPTVILLLLIVSTPITGFAFTIDDTNTYARGIGAYLAPITTWVYIAFVSFRATYYCIKHKLNPTLLVSVWLFIIPPLIGTIVQAVFYGVTAIQMGFTISYFMVFTLRQQDHISLDELTGLYNRNELVRYFNRQIGEKGSVPVFICFLDIEDFHSINIRFGRLEGDEVIRTVAMILRDACRYYGDSWFLARYGGDEFVIAGINRSSFEYGDLTAHIHEGLRIENERSNRVYPIALDIGYSTGIVENTSQLNSLVSEACQKMIRKKKKEDY